MAKCKQTVRKKQTPPPSPKRFLSQERKERRRFNIERRFNLHHRNSDCHFNKVVEQVKELQTENAKLILDANLSTDGVLHFFDSDAKVTSAALQKVAAKGDLLHAQFVMKTMNLAKEALLAAQETMDGIVERIDAQNEFYEDEDVLEDGNKELENLMQSAIDLCSNSSLQCVKEKMDEQVKQLDSYLKNYCTEVEKYIDPNKEEEQQ